MAAELDILDPWQIAYVNDLLKLTIGRNIHCTKLAAGIHWYLDPTSRVDFLPTYILLMDQCG